MTATTIQWIGAAFFALAVLHTFSAKGFQHLAHTSRHHAGLWHLLAEVEVVFGFWAMLLLLAMSLLEGTQAAVHYLEGRNFTEPIFVFVIMVIAGTKPVLYFAKRIVAWVTYCLPRPRSVATYFVTLSLVPLIGSFITEPAAMTLAALLLRHRYMGHGLPERLKYLTLAVLLVNVSIGGVLTPYAAPPVLMVAGKWGWDIGFMMGVFGWKAALAVLINAVGVTMLFWRDLAKVADAPAEDSAAFMPRGVVAMHISLLAGTVVFSHHPAVFVGLFLFFLGFTEAYQRYQDSLLLREGLLVAFFLAGLVVLGGQQRWWLQPIITGMEPAPLFLGATLLTAITDNAALTYLGSLVEGISDSAKYALVAGAVTGGGLTVIANAPNPAGFAILQDSFEEQSINPLNLFLSALFPTIIAGLCFWLL